MLDRITVASRPGVVMEFVGGPTLRDHIDTGIPIRSPKSTLLQFIDLLDGVAFAHRWGVVHRGIKPENILIDTRQTPPVWKLTDFGLAKLRGSSRVTQAGEVLGTARYMAPEQIAGETDHRADLYSLACCVAEVLTGTAPFTHDSDVRTMVAQLNEAAAHISDLNPEIPRGVGDVVARALSKEPEERFATCGAVSTALRRATRRWG